MKRERKYFHMCVDVRGALAQRDEALKSWIGNIKRDGESCKSVGEVRRFLEEALAEGYDYIGPEECDNFDKKHGCKGHQCEEDTQGE